MWELCTEYATNIGERKTWEPGSRLEALTADDWEPFAVFPPNTVFAGMIGPSMPLIWLRRKRVAPEVEGG